MTKVYSYRRFSSGRQAAGHSLQRQVESAKRWCAEHGYELDESLALADLGLSAFKGDHVSRGALSGFLVAVEGGRIPKGSILLVESLDRLSREALPEAVGLLTKIVRSGVRIVSLIDNQEWNEKTIEDTMNFMVSVILFSRAHEESATKAKRVSAAFQRKRTAQLPVVSHLHGPGWVLPKVDNTGWKVDRAKATSVKKVFELAAKGYGGVSIARMGNQEGWTLPWKERKNSSGKWEHTAISRLLRDRRALGEWQPMRMVNFILVPDGEPVKQYFPQVINEDLWHRVQVAVSGRVGPKRTHGLKSDIFAGLFYCQCGQRMERKAPSSRGSARYYCLGRKAGLSKCEPISERAVVACIMSQVPDYNKRTFSGDDQLRSLLIQLEVFEAKLADCKERERRIADTIERAGPSDIFVDRLIKIQAEEAGIKESIEKINLERLEISSSLNERIGSDFADEILAAVEDKNAIERRYEVAQKLARVVKRIEWQFTKKQFWVEGKDGTHLNISPDPYSIQPYSRFKPHPTITVPIYENGQLGYDDEIDCDELDEKGATPLEVAQESKTHNQD